MGKNIILIRIFVLVHDFFMNDGSSLFSKNYCMDQEFWIAWDFTVPLNEVCKIQNLKVIELLTQSHFLVRQNAQFNNRAPTIYAAVKSHDSRDFRTIHV